MSQLEIKQPVVNSALREPASFVELRISPNGRKANTQNRVGYEWAINGLRLGYKQKRLTEVSLCCRGNPRIYWLRRLDLN